MRWVIALCLLLAGGLQAQENRPQETRPALLGIFNGTLPCADCGGVETRVALIAEDGTASRGRFELRQTYLGRHDGTLIKSGNWVAREVTDPAPRRLFQLDAGKSDVTAWLQIDADHLAPLGPDQKPATVTLARQKADLPNPATLNCSASGGMSEIRNGSKGAYGVCHLPDGRACEEWALFRGGQCNALRR